MGGESEQQTLNLHLQNMFLNIYPTLCQVCATSLALKKRVGKANCILREKGGKKKKNTERIRARVVAEASGVSVLCVSYLMSETEL